LIDIQIIASSSKGNCYFVTDGVSPLLIEAGISWKEIQKAVGFRTDINSCLISHSHGDHSKAVKDVMKSGINCYMRPDEEFALSGHRLIKFYPGETLEIDTWKIRSFEIIHDVPGLGFYMVNQQGERLLYATDTAYIVPRFAGLTHIMIECNYSLDILNRNVESGTIPVEMKKRLLKTHFSLEHVKDFLRANDLSKVQEIRLLHLSDNNSDEERFKREIASITGKPVYIAQ